MPVFLISHTSSSLAKKFSLGLLEKRTHRLLKYCRREDFGISVVFTDDAEIKTLNRDYRHRDTSTNVLSFPFAEGNEFIDDNLSEKELGDVIISVDTALRETVELGISLHDRLTILVIHGLLHLLGYDHERSDHDAEVMQEKERELFEQLHNNRSNTMAHLAVNVDHVATIREARGIIEPDPVQAAGICELAGASGVVVHLREDRRHIQDRDVILLRQTVKTKLNLEMATADEIIDIAIDIKPDMVTLVPEKRQELSTEGGLDVIGQIKKIERTIKRMTDNAIPVSLFIDPAADQITASHTVGATFVEIHTGRYCDAQLRKDQDEEFALIEKCAEQAFELGLLVNAGHGLDYQTTQRIAALDTIDELSIGHAIITRSIFVGLDQAVREMLALIRHSQTHLS